MRSSVHLIEVQRGVIAKCTDGCQFNQGVILSAFHTFTILVPEDTRAILTCSSKMTERVAIKQRPPAANKIFYWNTYTSPSGA